MSSDLQYINFKCLEATQPIGQMYIGVMNHTDLEHISYADVRRLELGTENREVEDYIGIQRHLDPKREKEIGKYVNLVDATFPNSIILSISSKYASFDKKTQMMTIVYKDYVAKVLDGQHRIAGLRHFKLPGDQFEVIVTIYLDMELEDQALVFATINKEQKNVSNSLVADLFAFANGRSPQKTAHNIVRALNKKDTSPFNKKIKILGIANNKELETITQATFVKSIIQYISNDPQSDRDFYRRNINNNKKLDLVNGKDEQKLFFRNLFIEDDQDVKIAQILFNYFTVVKEKWPQAWNEVRPEYILNKSTGFVALMRFLKDAFLSFNSPGTVISKDQFRDIFDKITITEDKLVKDVYIPGSSGQALLYKDLVEQSGLSEFH
jgi:DGQHR domain-containing protein